MKINGDTYFLGAYHQRMLKQSSTPLNDANRMETVSDGFRNLGLQVLPAAILSLSDEAKSLLSQNGLDKMTHDVEELYQKHRESRIREFGETDEFALKGNDQWLVFSEFLYKNGFYDDMSNEDVKNSEQILMEITDGMDDVFSWKHQIGIDLYDQLLGEQLDSNEARVELESSFAALRYFSENLLTGANKEGFDELINKYYTHNSEILNNGYTSIQEGIFLGRSKLPDHIKERLETERFNYPRNEQAEREGNAWDILGSITNSEEEINNYINDISSLFATMNQENNFADILSKVKERFLMFVTNKTDNIDLKDYVLKRSEDTFANINNYWSHLTELVKTTG